MVGCHWHAWATPAPKIRRWIRLLDFRQLMASKYTGVLCMRCSMLQLPQATKRLPKIWRMPCGAARWGYGLNALWICPMQHQKKTHCLAQYQQIKTTLFLIASPTWPLVLYLTIAIYFCHVRDPKMSFRTKFILEFIRNSHFVYFLGLIDHPSKTWKKLEHMWLWMSHTRV